MRRVQRSLETVGATSPTGVSVAVVVVTGLSRLLTELDASGRTPRVGLSVGVEQRFST